MTLLKKILLSLLFISILFCLPELANAQIDPNCDPDCPFVPSCPPECIPLDGGVLLLIAVGIGIGANKAMRSQGNIK